MDFAGAQKLFTKKSPYKRRLQYKTWIWRESEEETIHLQLFETDILTFKPDGNIILNNGGHPTRTTHSRFREYLGCYPWGHSLEPHGDRVLVLCPPSGKGRPWKNGAEFTRDFERTDLTQMNREDAWLIIGEVHRYAIAYMRRLVFHGLPNPHDRECRFCREGEAEEEDLHLLGHIRSGEFAPRLVVNAMMTFGSGAEEELIRDCFPQRRHLWQPPRNQWDSLKLTESVLQGIGQARSPKPHFRGLRLLFERFLLVGLGFEMVREKARNPARMW
jgi:hypothetical protein